MRLDFVTSSMATGVTPRLAVVGNYSVSVSNDGWEWSPEVFRLQGVGDGALLAVNPSRVHAGGGETVTILGSGFTGEALEVMFGNNLVTCRVKTDLQVTCAPKVDAPARVMVHMVGCEGTKVEFEFEEAPVVVAVHPSRGPVSGGTLVYVTGKGFSGTQVASCRLGEHSVPATVLSSSLVHCLTPVHKAVLEPFVLLGGLSAFEGSPLHFEFYSNFEIHRVFPSASAISTRRYQSCLYQ